MMTNSVNDCCMATEAKPSDTIAGMLNELLAILRELCEVEASTRASLLGDDGAKLPQIDIDCHYKAVSQMKEYALFALRNATEIQKNF